VSRPALPPSFHVVALGERCRRAGRVPGSAVDVLLDAQPLITTPEEIEWARGAIGDVVDAEARGRRNGSQPVAQHRAAVK
jgi:hypothetical protein